MGEPQMSVAAERPTWVRWRIVSLILAYVAFCHFNRISISVAGNRILADYDDISETTMGLVYSAYLIFYTVFMTPGGWLIDGWGPKRALVLMGFGSAVGVMLTGLVGFTVTAAGLLVVNLFLVRSLMGVFSAPIHPAGARLVSHWVPWGARPGANGLVTASACVGIAATYFGFGFLMDHYGWPLAFVVAGLATTGLAALWTAYVTDWPAQHSQANHAERVLIDPTARAEVEIAPTDGPPKAAASSLLANRSLVFLTISYAAVGYFEYLFFYWMERYFGTELGLDTETSRLYSTICTLAMGVGMFGGGRLADRLQQLLGQRRGRALVPAVGMVLGALLLIPGILSTEPRWIVTWFALALAACGASEGPFWTTAIELGGSRGGTAAGICNTGGNAGGLLAPSLTPLLAGALGWHWAIAFSSLLCILGAVLWIWIVPGMRPQAVSESR